MDHNLPLITTIAAGLGLALLLGFCAARLRLPALVGYLLAGVVIGPFTPGFVADTKLASELAEIGVMLLMFGVGLHFSLGDLLAVRRIAIPGAIVQIVAATAMGVAVATFRLFIGATGANAAGTEVFFDTPPGGIAVGSYFDFYPARGIKLTSTDFLVGGASLATTLTIMAEGEQFVV